MSISDIGSKIKGFIADDRVFMVLLIFFVGITSFGLGRMSTVQLEREPIRISENALAGAVIPKEEVSADGGVVGSKNGTKYHLPGCPGAKQISEANLVRFSSIDDAKRAGYEPALNCPGLK